MFQKGHKIINKPKALENNAITVLKHGKYLDNAKHAPKSKARDLYVKYIENDAVLTPKQAIVAQCGHCSGWYVDGKIDCECPDCPLYRYMPYGKYRKIRVQGATK